MLARRIGRPWMKLHLVGCSHRSSSVDIRERLAFTPAQTVEALRQLRTAYPGIGSRLAVDVQSSRIVRGLSRNDRASRPASSSSVSWPTSTAWTIGMSPDTCFSTRDVEAVRHLFMRGRQPGQHGDRRSADPVAGETGFCRRAGTQTTGPVTHLAFEAANRVAKRVATETEINRRRVSIPSVAVADFARQFFETFHDKNVLLLGAGEMGEETLRYLREEGARQIVILNRSATRADDLAERLGATADDLGTSGDPAGLGRSGRQHHRRSRSDCHGRASSRAFSNSGPNAPCSFSTWPSHGISIPPSRNFSNVYLFCIDDLKQTCERNRAAREEEWPEALQIVEEETARFVADANHRDHRPHHPTTQTTSRRAQERRTASAAEQAGGNRRPHAGRNRAIFRATRQQTAASTPGIPAR